MPKPAAATSESAQPAKVAVQLANNYKPVVLEPPEREQYSVALPEGITAFDLDVIRLTAQLVARNGKGFLTGLTAREHSNSQARARDSRHLRRSKSYSLVIAV